MKRILLILLVFVICFSVIACGQTKEVQEETVEADSVSTESAEPAVTEEPEPIATEPPKEIHWTEEFYVDDFGDPTDESYIRGIFEGEFSNSATSGSNLTAIFFMEKDLAKASYDMFTIRLLEYGNHKQDFLGCDYSDVIIKIKVDGIVTEDSADYLLSDTGEIVIQRGNEIFEAVLNALNEDKEIAVVIEVGGYGTNLYRFDVDTNGLADIPHEWKGRM